MKIKKFFCLLIVILLLISTACGQKPANQPSLSEQSALSSGSSADDVPSYESGEDPDSSDPAPSFSETSENDAASLTSSETSENHTASLTSDVMRNAAEEFYAFVRSLRVDRISKIETGQGGIVSWSVSTSDPEMIKQCLEVFSSIRIDSVEPYYGMEGCNDYFTVYDQDGNVYDSFAIVDEYISFDHQLTYLKIGGTDLRQLGRLTKEMKEMGEPTYSYYQYSPVSSDPPTSPKPEYTTEPAESFVKESWWNPWDVSSWSGPLEGSVPSAIYYSHPTAYPSSGDIPLDTIKARAEEKEAFFKSISAENIAEFEVAVMAGISPMVYTRTTDPELIQKWVKWLHSIELLGDCNELFSDGGSIGYYYYDRQGNRYHLFTDSGTIEKYYKIKQQDTELYQQLRAEMGF